MTGAALLLAASAAALPSGPGLRALAPAATTVATPPTAAQSPGAEQRAFDAVDRAVARLEAAVGRDRMMRTASGVLDAAEGALRAFDVPDEVRDAAYAQYHATLTEVDALAVRCENGFPCATDARGATGVVHAPGLAAAYARSWEARSGLSAANAAYVEAVGITGAAGARARTARFRRLADRMRGLRGNSPNLLQRQRELIRAANADNDALNALNDRATAAHVAANRAVLDALGSAARALAAAARRLAGDHHPGTRAAGVFRAAALAERAAAAAANPAVPNDGNRTDAALDGLISAARETLAAIESHEEGGG